MLKPLVAICGMSLLIYTPSAAVANPNQLDAVFNPPVGSEVRFDEKDLREFRLTRPLSVRGYITVQPLPGKCATIRRHMNARDLRICQNDALPFTADDLSERGMINWEYVRDDGTTTLLTWKTPHRLIRFVPSGVKLESISTTTVMESCRATRDSRGESIKVHLLSGDEWSIFLPNEHKWVDPDINKVKEPVSETTEKPEDGHGEAPKEAKQEPKAEAATGDSSSWLVVKKKDNGDRWSVPKRSTFTMSSTNFVTSSGRSGPNGECRYRFGDLFTSASVPWIECHRVGMMDYVLIQLPCLSEFSPGLTQ